jgi:integrase
LPVKYAIFYQNIIWARNPMTTATFAFLPPPGLATYWISGLSTLTVQLLANLQVESDEGNPYVFIKTKRLKHILRHRAQGTWQPDYELVNNLCRSLEVICRRAEVKFFTLHDLRRTCITNWAKKLPIQTVQHLAGHSNMMTTRKYYLSVQNSDLEAARKLQSKLMTQLTNY